MNAPLAANFSGPPHDPDSLLLVEAIEEGFTVLDRIASALESIARHSPRGR